MKSILCFLVFGTCSVSASGSTRTDTCFYSFVDNDFLDSMDQWLKLKQLKTDNSGKGFYLALVEFSMGHIKQLKVREFTSVNESEIRISADSLYNFDWGKIQIDSSVMFNRIGDPGLVSFTVMDQNGGPFHAPLTVMILKIRNKTFQGSTIEGCQIAGSMLRILETCLQPTQGDLIKRLSFLINGIRI